MTPSTHKIRECQGYTGTAKVLHWLIFVLLFAQFIVGWTMPHIGRNTQPETLINVHFSIGVLALFVATLRLAWRVGHAEPPPEAGIPPWQTKSARVVHWLLYMLLFVVPILGWLNASWRGFAVTLFGLPMPNLVVARNPSWAWTGDTHVFLANYVLLALVGLHVAAALYHLLVRGDRVLHRMLP